MYEYDDMATWASNWHVGMGVGQKTGDNYGNFGILWRISCMGDTCYLNYPHFCQFTCKWDGLPQPHHPPIRIKEIYKMRLKFEPQSYGLPRKHEAATEPPLNFLISQKLL